MTPLRPALLRFLANLDQIDVVVQEIHTPCVGTTLERKADMMRESTWEMRAAIEAALNGSSSSSNGL